MERAVSRIVVAAVAAVAAVVLVSGAALAASGGGYSNPQQDCPDNASSWNAPPDSVPPGCHNFAVNVESGGTTNGDANSNNTRYAEFGIDQLPNNANNPSFGALENVGDPGTPDSPHSGCLAANTDGTGGGSGTGCGDNQSGAGFSATYDYYAVYCMLFGATGLSSTPNPTGHTPALYACQNTPTGQAVNVTPDQGTTVGFDPSQGLVAYIGANDNLDNGEHDGFSGLNSTDESQNGSSDGGAITLSVTPQSAGNAPTASNPEGLVNDSEGACADGICAGVSTQRQSVYQGCSASAPDSTSTADSSTDEGCAPGTAQNNDVYQNNNPSSTQESAACNSGDQASEQACYTNADGTSNPGGADAYRQSTPTNNNVEPGVQTYQDPDPQRSPAGPVATPGIYVGTCGVYVNDSGGYGKPGVTGQNPGYVVGNFC